MVASGGLLMVALQSKWGVQHVVAFGSLFRWHCTASEVLRMVASGSLFMVALRGVRSKAYLVTILVRSLEG